MSRRVYHLIQKARRRTEAIGASANQYLEQLVGESDSDADASEFERLSRVAPGNSGGWKFNRAELHERRRAPEWFALSRAV